DGREESVKRTHSNLALSVLSLTQPDLTRDRVFKNVFEKPGKQPRVYLQRIRESVLNQWLNPSRREESALSHVPDVSEWVAVSNPGFRCNRSSLFFDANHDGHIDVLTGNRLYLASDVPG